MLSLAHTIARNPRTASRTWPAETVVYLPDGNTIHSLNETASVVWEFLIHRPTVAQIVRHVAHEFEVSEEQATQDVKTLLETLAARNLVIFSGGLDDGNARGVSATARESDKAERQIPLLYRIKDRAREQNIPMHALLELTNNCNLWCRHCYITHRPAKGELTLDEIKPILDQLADLGVLFLTLTGGEALSRKDFFSIAEYARQRDFSFSLFTNGTLITPSVADRLKELALERAEISILGATAATHDAITQVEGSFEKAIEGARLLIDRGINVQLKTTWMKLNIDESEEIRDLVDSLGVTSFRGGNLIIHRRDGSSENSSLAAEESQMRAMQQRRLDRHPGAQLPPDPPPLSEEQKKDIIPCGAGQTSLRIDAYGNVYPCAAINVLLGDAKTTPLAEIWYGSEELEKIRAIRLADLPECSACDLWQRCTRCAGLALMETGSLLAASPQACRVARIQHKFLEEKQCELQ
jgi:radical SAM protein with 4Fe4S-binding SPASM domain